MFCFPYNPSDKREIHKSSKMENNALVPMSKDYKKVPLKSGTLTCNEAIAVK